MHGSIASSPAVPVLTRGPVLTVAFMSAHVKVINNELIIFINQ